MPYCSSPTLVHGLFSVPASATTPTPTSSPSASQPAALFSAPEGRPIRHAVIEPSADMFTCFASELRRELAPASLLEHVLVERVVLAAWRLETISREETREALSVTDPLRPIERESVRAESSLETALILLKRARALHTAPRWQRGAESDSKAGRLATHEDSTRDADEFDDLSNEWTFVPAEELSAPGIDEDDGIDLTDPDDLPLLDIFGDFDEDEEGDEDEDDAESDEPGAELAAALESTWSGRLVFDTNVSTTSPVVKGTWVTASQVVSRIVDGWTWSDVLRTHPELTEDDVRACLAYTVAQDNGEV